MLIMMLSLADFLQYLGLNRLLSEIIAFTIILTLSLFTAWIVYWIFKKYLLRWAEKTDSKLICGILQNIRGPILLIAILFGVYYGLVGITSLQNYTQEIALTFTVGQILVVTYTITRIANVLIRWYAEESAKRGKHVSNHLLFILQKVLHLVIYTFALLIILSVFNINLSGIIVGLGVGGIAVALAIQNILSDALTAFSIYFDHSFEIGDFIVVGDHAGTVTKIGIISTRIKLLQGEELIISNKNLIATSVRNFKKLQKRRVVFTVNVTYETSIEKLKRIPQIIAKIITNTELTTLDRVHFSRLSDFSLDFEVVYYIETGDYTKYMDIQQSINYGILEEFEKESIDIAYPTQKVFYVNEKEAA
jgi:small-conductance mechanosensitive channel